MFLFNWKRKQQAFSPLPSGDSDEYHHTSPDGPQYAYSSGLWSTTALLSTALSAAILTGVLGYGAGRYATQYERHAEFDEYGLLGNITCLV